MAPHQGANPPKAQPSLWLSLSTAGCPPRPQDFQVVSLKLLASELLLACPGYGTQYEASYLEDVGADRKQKRTLYSDIYVPGEITEAVSVKVTNIRIYASPNNPGAREVAQALQEEIAGLELSTKPTVGIRNWCSGAG